MGHFVMINFNPLMTCKVTLSIAIRLRFQKIKYHISCIHMSLEKYSKLDVIIIVLMLINFLKIENFLPFLFKKNEKMAKKH